MIITNQHKIPEWLVNIWIPSEPYKSDPKRMSVTALSDAPRMRTLQIERFEDKEEDVVDHLNFFDGNNLDSAFDKIENKEDLVFWTQEKLEIEIDGMTLVGKPDIVVTDGFNLNIIDNKRCKVGQLAYPERLQSWAAQLNLYRWMWNKSKGEQATQLQNHMYYKDFTPVRPDVPIGFHILEQPLWDLEETEKYIHERLKIHREKPYSCPEEGRWTTFAVRTKGKKRADRVLKTRAECEQWMKETGRGDFIETRDGLRCKWWCGARSICPDSPVCIQKFKGRGLDAQ